MAVNWKDEDSRSYATVGGFHIKCQARTWRKDAGAIRNIAPEDWTWTVDICGTTLATAHRSRDGAKGKAERVLRTWLDEAAAILDEPTLIAAPRGP